MASQRPTAPALKKLDPDQRCGFLVPVKRIHGGEDVNFFLASRAYADIMTFIFQLNTAMLPRRNADTAKDTESAKEWIINDRDVSRPRIVQSLAKLLQDLTAIIEEVPPDPGPRRFGNVSFRKWYDIVKERVTELLGKFISREILDFKTTSDVSARGELEAYLIGSFGSSQRLDYGTGHELSFLAFLGCLWKLGAFPESNDGDSERAIVLGIIEPYLVLVRRLILTYTLEPAGSHGVWGLDDHAFLPYIFGSAQFSPAINTPADIVTEGSLPSAPNPADVAKANAVERERKRNMYFSAIGFIYDVKKGPFWEHSPILYDVSGVKAGWAKINKGMIKMYNAEVLSKFPVVQHFPFGSMFAWEKDPSAKSIQASVHTSSQPKASTVPSPTSSTSAYSSPRPQPQLRDPLADPLTPSASSHSSQPALRNPLKGMGPATTAAPWAKAAPAAGPNVPSGPNQPTRAPWANRTTALPPPGGTMVGTSAPWATGNAAAGKGTDAEASTRAPWADKKPQ
ncbi:serine/threonine-protein phosphatase 2A activator 1 [Setomelanomma holmii]|uniref:Serine/threonine-protein phosphatase 2A activator n=1 Tax=Setomelanomma holmii TaxID=210430 RepID=A0A9P4LLG7_9PLEO|nr:serine/threonine-protein phosphatase 2A activator 1 [Setomelanomma holmii]